MHRGNYDILFICILKTAVGSPCTHWIASLLLLLLYLIKMSQFSSFQMNGMIFDTCSALHKNPCILYREWFLDMFLLFYLLILFILVFPYMSEAGSSPNQSPTGWSQSQTQAPAPAQRESALPFNAPEKIKIVSRTVVVTVACWVYSTCFQAP